jgi:hypothetical protein
MTGMCKLLSALAVSLKKQYNSMAALRPMANLGWRLAAWLFSYSIRRS